MTSRVAASARAIAVATVVLLLPASPASAHSSLEQSAPAKGATVETAPDELVLTFSDPVTVPDGVISVLDLAGRNIASDEVQVDGQTVTIPLDDDGTGTRIVAWSVVSDHGTAVTGSFEYHVGEVTPGARAETGANVDQPVRRTELTHATRAIAGTSLALAIVATMLALLSRRRRRDAGGWDMVLRGFLAVLVVAGAAGAVLAVDDDVRVALLVAAAFGVVGVVLATRPRPWVAIVTLVLLIGGLGGVVAASPSEPVPRRFEQEVAFGEETTALVTMEPTIAGQVDVEVVVSDADGSPNEDIVRANLRYQPDDESLGNFETALESTGDGRFVAEDVLVPFAGPWKFELTVSEDRFSASLASFDVSFAANPEVA